MSVTRPSISLPSTTPPPRSPDQTISTLSPNDPPPLVTNSATSSASPLASSCELDTARASQASSPSPSAFFSVSDEALSRASSPSHSHPSSPLASARSLSSPSELPVGFGSVALRPPPFTPAYRPHARMTESMYSSSVFSSTERYLPSEWNDPCSVATAESLAFARLLLEQEAKLAAGRCTSTDLLARTLASVQPSHYPQHHSLPYTQNLAYLLHSSQWLPLDHYRLDSSSRNWFVQQQNAAAVYSQQTNAVSASRHTSPDSFSPSLPWHVSSPPPAARSSIMSSQAATFAISGKGTISASDDSVPLLKFVGLDPGRLFRSCVHPTDWSRTEAALESVRSDQMPCAIVDSIHLRSCSIGDGAHALCQPLECVAESKDCSYVLGKLCITAGSATDCEDGPAFFCVLSLSS